MRIKINPDCESCKYAALDGSDYDMVYCKKGHKVSAIKFICTDFEKGDNNLSGSGHMMPR